MKENPYCPDCHGRGAVLGEHGWMKCQCVVGTPAAREAQKRINSIGTEQDIRARLHKALAESVDEKGN